MNLRTTIKARYKNGPDNIGRDFVAPCLREAVLYRRGTGFFSSGAMIAYVDALDKLVSEKIKIEIICSPVISDRSLFDVLARNITEAQRKETIRRYADSILLAALGYKMNQERRDYRRQLLAYFIAKNILEIKFAVPFDLTNFRLEDESEQSLSENLYHVKTGYFKFSNGDTIAFDGSFNESDSGHKRHIDKTQVFRSWELADSQRLVDVVADIDEDWSGKNQFIEVFPLGEEAMELARKFSPDSRPKRSDSPIVSGVGDRQPEQGVVKGADGLREYQKNALAAWRSSDYQGILAMATGTGKTRTAIAAIHALRKASDNALIVVTAPYQPLAAQWIKELARAELPTLKVYDSASEWSGRVVNIVQAHMSGIAKSETTPVLVCVNKTFKDKNFQSILSLLGKSKANRMLIVDECHHFNSPESTKCLPEHFDFRLGLSATPYESDEPHYLNSYFSRIVFEYTVSEAIEAGYLSKYYYRPIFIELSESEAIKYVRICDQIRGGEVIKDSESTVETGAIKFYRELDEVLENVVGKLSRLADILPSIRDRKHSLFYCGVGSVTFVDGTQLRQISAVTQLLHKMDWTVSKVTYEERSPEQRSQIFQDFSTGAIDAMASIRVLDEGVDIPDCKRAFILASQRSERQGIQRRGRILRKSALKESAELFDFIITGPRSEEKFLRNLYDKELRRAALFSSDAINRDECFRMIEQTR